jgi:hypothetical protein
MPPVLLLTCDATAGGATSGGASVAGGGVTVAGGGVSVVAGGGVCAAGGGVSVVAGGGGAGVCVVSPSVAGGGIVAQLPLASTGEPSGHDCAYEDCRIDDDDDCTVRIAAVTRITLVIIIDSLPFISVISF